jgi:hypothetical protein
VRSAIGIDIDAAPDLIFGLAHDVERWSTLLPHYVRSRLRERDAAGRSIVLFVARRPLLPALGLGLPVVWAARTWHDAATWRLYFEHVAGATRGMRVTWRIEPRPGGGSRVTIEHDFTPRIPGLARVVDRWFTRPIAGRTLATFKALAEAVAGSRPEPATSAEPAATNRSI